MNSRPYYFFWVPSLICNYFWLFLIALISNLFSAWGLTFFTFGILVVLPALLMAFYRGLVNVILAGFLVDAGTPTLFEMTGTMSFFSTPYELSLFGDMPQSMPVFFGFITGWMIFAYLVLRFVRSRLDLNSPSQWIVCAIALNAVIFFFWGIAMGWSQLGSWEYWWGFFLNFIFSSGILLVLGWWYFDLLLCCSRIFGQDLVAERDVECG